MAAVVAKSQVIPLNVNKISHKRKSGLKFFRIVVLFSGIFFIFGILHLFQYVKLLNLEKEISKLNFQREMYINENNKLLSEIVRLRSEERVGNIAKNILKMEKPERELKVWIEETPLIVKRGNKEKSSS